MPDHRLLQPVLGHSIKLSQLSHLEFRVWAQYLLCANDCGVMLKSASIVRGANLVLEREPADTITAALDRLVEVGLLLPFEHQGLVYLVDPVWQDHQKSRIMTDVERRQIEAEVAALAAERALWLALHLAERSGWSYGVETLTELVAEATRRRVAREGATAGAAR